MIDTIRSLVFWIIGGIYFVVFLVTAYILSFLFPLERIDPFLKALLRFFFKLILIKVDVSGLEHIQKNRSYLFMINHISFLDIPLVGGFIPVYLRGVEALWQHKWPLYGRVMGRLGNIPIDRNNVHASVSAIRKAIAYTRNGKSLIIFPEGGRTLDGELKSFKKLPFHLAKKANLDLVPLGICDLYQLNNATSYSIRPGRIRLKIGEPIPQSEIEEMDTLALRDRVRSEIEAMISES
ncbi:MAG: hypothetical protein CSA81_08175 [Acidobacteria bacterium]|nr:MAG: hypothetical protein CSA81_08175 [Acidobacteriota bacterium]PIE89701.1 MAG: hypothetical protein CR997_09710 [Acidobacteriota bacterium]